jgi:hypothetical protein
MNTFSKNTKALFALLLSCCLLAVSCKDDEQPVTEPEATITSIDPTSGPVGTQVAIDGANFGDALDDHMVDFNGTQAQITSVTDNRIVVEVPEGATDGNVNLKVRGATVTGPVFTVEEEPAATITAIDPTSGPVGTEVTITGTGFGDGIDDHTVEFNGTQATIASVTDEEIVVSVPSGASTGVVVLTMGGMPIEGPEFTVEEENQKTEITSISPSMGPIGTVVRISGNNFGDSIEDVSVQFNGTDAVVTEVTKQRITVTVPEGATSGMVTVTIGEETYNGPEFTIGEVEGGFNYGNGFTGAEGEIEALGQAFIYEGGGINGEDVLRLVPEKEDRTGAAYFGGKVNVAGGFETSFDFRISRPGKPEGVEGERGADGFSFIIQNQGLDAIGSRGADMGYGGIKQAVVVEFDIYKNEADGDPNGNHVGVQVSRGNGAVQADESYRIAVTTAETHPGLPEFIGNEMQFHTARVVYIPGELQIWIDNLETPLVANITLENYIDSTDGTAFVGFTASTSPEYGWAAFDILNWVFEPSAGGNK